jgi:hypothetical protein
MTYGISPANCVAESSVEGEVFSGIQVKCDETQIALRAEEHPCRGITFNSAPKRWLHQPRPGIPPQDRGSPYQGVVGVFGGHLLPRLKQRSAQG